MKSFRSVLFSLFLVAPAVFAEPVNINTASADEIAMALNGIGLSKAEAIVAYRDSNGAFTDVQQLSAVRGIGEKTLQRISADILLAQPE
jgi:competence protein ComEA